MQLYLQLHALKGQNHGNQGDLLMLFGMGSGQFLAIMALYSCMTYTYCIQNETARVNINVVIVHSHEGTS